MCHFGRKIVFLIFANYTINLDSFLMVIIKLKINTNSCTVLARELEVHTCVCKHEVVTMVKDHTGPDGDGAAFVSIPLSFCVIETFINAPHALPTPNPLQRSAIPKVPIYFFRLQERINSYGKKLISALL